MSVFHVRICLLLYKNIVKVNIQVKITIGHFQKIITLNKKKTLRVEDWLIWDICYDIIHYCCGYLSVVHFFYFIHYESRVLFQNLLLNISQKKKMISDRGTCVC